MGGCCGLGGGSKRRKRHSDDFYSQSSYNSLDDLELDLVDQQYNDQVLPEVLSPKGTPWTDDNEMSEMSAQPPNGPPPNALQQLIPMPAGTNPIQLNTNLALPAAAALRQADFQQSHSRSRSVSFGSRSMSLLAMRVSMQRNGLGMSPVQMNHQSSNLTNLTTSSAASGLGESPFQGNAFRPPTLNLTHANSVPAPPISAVQNLSALPSASPAPNAHKRKKKKDRKSVSFQLGSNNSNPLLSRGFSPMPLATQIVKKDSSKKKRKHAKTKTTVDTDKKVSDWSESDCSAWVKSLGAAYSKYAQIFTDNGVNGSLLIEMFDADFQSLGIDHKFHIKKLQMSLGKRLTSEEKHIRKNAGSSRTSKSKSKSVSKSKSRPRPDIPLHPTIRKATNDGRGRIQRGMTPQASAPSAGETKGYNTRLERNKMVGAQMQQMPGVKQRKVKKKKRKRAKQPATATYGTMNMNTMNTAPMNTATSSGMGYPNVMHPSAYNQPSTQARFITAAQTATIRSSKTKHMYKKRKSKPKRSKSRGAMQTNQHMNPQYLPSPQIAAQGMNPQFQTIPQSQFNQGSIQTTISATTMSPKFMKNVTNQSNSSQPTFASPIYQTQNFQAMDPRWTGVYE